VNDDQSAQRDKPRRV